MGNETSADCGKCGDTSANRAGSSTRPGFQKPVVEKRAEGRVETRVLSNTVTSVTRNPIAILRKPQSARSEVGKMNAIFPLKSRNYKVSASVGVNTAVISPVRAILDTGAGPNLIRATVLPEDWERYRVFGAPTLNIVGAGGRRLRQSGTVTLHVEIGGIKLRARFLVMETLAAECILGCQFINRHVSAILPKEKHVRLSDGSLIPILRDSDPLTPPSSQEKSPAEPLVSTKVRIAKFTTVPRRSESRANGRWLQSRRPYAFPPRKRPALAESSRFS